jgi:hypothetical protein
MYCVHKKRNCAFIRAKHLHSGYDEKRNMMEEKFYYANQVMMKSTSAANNRQRGQVSSSATTGIPKMYSIIVLPINPSYLSDPLMNVLANRRTLVPLGIRVLEAGLLSGCASRPFVHGWIGCSFTLLLAPSSC